MSTHADIMDYLLQPPPEPVSAAERSRAWRERKKLEGRPDLKVVDAAISEAMAFLMSLATTAPVLVDAKAIVRVATIALVRDGYSREHSKACVVDRLRPRERHSSVSCMPSTDLSANAGVIQPPARGRWEERDLAYIRKLTGKSV